MALLVTDALVLHAFDYLESSRILRLATREAGVQSVIAKGARRSHCRYGSALDLFAEGSAQLHLKPGRELHILSAFDVAKSRPQLAGDLGRFAGASAVAELTLRFARDDAHPTLFAAVSGALDAIGAASAGDAREAALAGAWHIVAELGFAPSLEACSVCHAMLAVTAPILFHHPVGGALCGRCADGNPGGRSLPAAARAALRAWIRGARNPIGTDAEARAHQRLLREFLREHLADDRPLRAFEAWEHAPWSAA